MVLPVGTARSTRLRRTTTLTILGALAILLAVPSYAFASPAHATGPAMVTAGHAQENAAGVVPMHNAIAALAAESGPAFGQPLHCTAASMTTAHCANSRPAAATAHPSAVPYGWQNASPGQGPVGNLGESYGAMMAWDPVDNEIVYYGGCDQSACPDSQTWIFWLNAWWNATISYDLPPAVYEASMTYDYVSHSVVLFGGCGTVCPMNETWTFSGGFWSDRSAPYCYYYPYTFCYWAPSPRLGASMAFANDSADNVTVLFGGCLDIFCYGADNQTWEWFGSVGAWLDVSSSVAPSPREFASMAYDPVWGGTILFGGCNYYCVFNDTWQFYSGAWSDLTAENTFFGFETPEARGLAEITYDASTGALYLFGGFNGFQILNNMWAFECPYFCGWVNITPAINLPGAVDLSAIAQESTQYAPLMRGGGCSCGSPLDSTWVFEPVFSAGPTIGPNPAPALTAVNFTAGLSGGSAPYFWYWFPGDGSYLFFDGSHNYTAPGTYAASMTLLDRYGVEVLYTTNVTITTTGAQALVAHATTDVGVLDTFSTASATGGTAPYVYNWTYGDGTWALGGPSITHAYAAVGTYQANLTVTDVHGLTNVSNVSVTVVAGPSVTVAASATAIDLGGSVTFTPTASGGSGAFTYAWTLGDGATSTTTAPAHIFATSGTFHVNVTVTDAAGGTATTSVSVTVYPAVAGTASGTPSAITAGGTVNFTVAGSGGSGTYTYVWTFGDGNKSTVATVSHAYAKAGTYTAHVWVNDSLGGSYTHAFTVTVAAAPGGSGSSTSSSLPSWAPWAALGIILLVVVVIAAMMMMRRKKTPPASSAPPMGAGAGTSSTPPPGAQ